MFLQRQCTFTGNGRANHKTSQLGQLPCCFLSFIVFFALFVVISFTVFYAVFVVIIFAVFVAFTLASTIQSALG